MTEEPNAQKEIEIGADVYTTDGQEAGKVAYVVVRPPELQLTDLVVSTGAILGRDVVVPADQILAVEDGDVFLSIRKEGLKNYRDYIEIEYTKPPSQWVPPEGFYFPVDSVLLSSTLGIPEVEEVRVNAPPGGRGIREGMEVYSKDRHKVGEVDKVDIDLGTDRVLGFIVKEGFVFKHERRISIEDVEGLQEGGIVLKLNKGELEGPEQEGS